MTRKVKKYRVSFHAISVMPNDELVDPFAGMIGVANRQYIDHATQNGVTRQIWRLEPEGAPAESIRGQLRKLRREDLPEIGSTDQDGRQLDLPENEGVIEKNFFIFYRRRNLLVWHSNGNASNTNQFAKLLSTIWNCPVTIDPLIEADAMRRLLKDGVEVKNLQVSLPRPTNGGLYPNNDFSEDTVRLLNRSGGDRIKVSIGVDGRTKERRGKALFNVAKEYISDMLSMGASTLKADVIEDGVCHPIDLIANRVQCIQEAEVDSKYPANDAMFDLLRAAKDECNDAITAYFGEGDRAME